MEPVFVSLIYYCYVFLFCELGRQITNAATGNRSIRRTIHEFLGTLQLATCIFEGSLVGRYYGTWAYFLAVVGVLYVHTRSKGSEVCANPCPLFEEWLLVRSLTTRGFLLLLVTQLVAGFCSFRLAQLFWWLELSGDHIGWYTAFMCSTDLKVSLLHGIFYEFLATLVDRIFWLKAEQHLSPSVAPIVGCLEIGLVTITGVNLTGMYFNPILASSLNLGCEGLGSLEHCVVYWLGPCIGWVMGSRIHQATLFSRLKED